MSTITNNPAITIKCTFNEDTRRFTPHCSSEPEKLYADIAAHICKVFAIAAPTLALKYRDSDGDFVTVSSSSDLHEALHDGESTPRGSIIRLKATGSQLQPPEYTETPDAPLDVKANPTVETLSIPEMEAKIEPTERAAKAEKKAAKAEKKAAKDLLASNNFDQITHLGTGVTFHVSGKCLPNGTICFKQVDKAEHNVAIGPKGRLSHGGKQGPWAQFVLLQADEQDTYHLQSKGNFAQGWGLAVDESTSELSKGDARTSVWKITREGEAFTPVTPLAGYGAGGRFPVVAWGCLKKKDTKAEKKAAKAEKKDTKAEKKAARFAVEATSKVASPHGAPEIGFHQSKRAACAGIKSAIQGFLNPVDSFKDDAVTSESAAAAVTSLSVAAQWIRKKTGLKIKIEETSSEEALDFVKKLRGLDIPKWMHKGDVTCFDPQRVDDIIAHLAAPMLSLWSEAKKAKADEAAAAEAAEATFIEWPLDDSWNDEWDECLNELKEMGFEDETMNKSLLKETNGNMKGAVKGLIAVERSSRMTPA